MTSHVDASTARGTEHHLPVEELMVTMRDGCRLATDIYGATAVPRPVLFERTPYGKRRQRDSDQSRRDQPVPEPEQIAGFFVERGYVVVRQDCRGRGRSQGTFVKYLNEGDDGADSIAWIRAQPWCNGTVVMNGVSYSAHAQTALAAQNPPGLAAMFLDSGGFSSAYEVGTRMGGAFELKQATWAFRHAVASKEAAADPVLAEALAQTDIAEWFKSMPWRRGSSPLSVLPHYEQYLLDQWSEDAFSPYWQQPSIYSRGSYDRFPDIPSLHMSSWYDPYIRSAVENFTTLQARKVSPAHLVLGPWTHGKRCRSYAGDVDFGPNAFLDGNLSESYLQFRADWFDAVLGKPGGKIFPIVSYFVMGGGSGRRDDAGRLMHGGHWAQDLSWPPESASLSPMYLRADGTLEASPASNPATLSYTFDPANPVPTIGGQVTSGEPVMVGGAFDQTTSSKTFGAKEPYLPLSSRPDVLVFRSAMLTDPVTVVGPVSADLYVSTDAPDTDFTIKLIDEYPPSKDYPQGFAMNLTEGILRLRFRDSFTEPSTVEPGRVYRVRVEAPDTANLFAKGHRIRLDISSSNFPRFDVNPNTGQPPALERRKHCADNSLHLSASRPSVLNVHVLRPGRPS
jgi:uncharacterized protein